MTSRSSLRAQRGNPWRPSAWIAASCLLAMTVLAQAVAPPKTQEILQVGPHRAIKTIAASASTAGAGATIFVDAGDYPADVAVWQHDNISIRAVGGRVRLLARGAAAEGKAIWVVRAKGMRVEGFDFLGARVADLNGAGIRLERGTLVVRDCTFTDNQNGILTSNDPQVELEIVNSEFSYNGHGDGQSHNLYAGAIARLKRHRQLLPPCAGWAPAQKPRSGKPHREQQADRR